MSALWIASHTAGIGFCAPRIDLAQSSPLTVTAQRADLLRLLETHPDQSLADRVAIACGVLD